MLRRTWLGVASSLVVTGCSSPADRSRHRYPVAGVRVRILDLGDSGAFRPAIEALPAATFLVAVNGGFFDGARRPVGLAVSEGRAFSPLDRALGGGVVWLRDKHLRLSAAETFDEQGVDFAVQARPRLVVDGQVNIRRDDGRRAARMALCLRDGGRTLELVHRVADDASAGPTLFELAHELVACGCEGALNLDGGPSVGWAEQVGGALELVEPRTPIRHAIVIERMKVE